MHIPNSSPSYIFTNFAKNCQGKSKLPYGCLIPSFLLWISPTCPTYTQDSPKNRYAFLVSGMNHQVTKLLSTEAIRWKATRLSHGWRIIEEQWLESWISTNWVYQCILTPFPMQHICIQTYANQPVVVLSTVGSVASYSILIVHQVTLIWSQ